MVHFLHVNYLWTDTKLIVNLELQEKFTRGKKPESFMIMRAKISAVRASGEQRLLTFLSLSQMWRFFKATLNQGRRLFE